MIGLWGYVGGLGAAIVAIIGFWLKAKSAGRAEARQAQEKANVGAAARGVEIQRDVRADGPAAAREYLRDHFKPGR